MPLFPSVGREHVLREDDGVQDIPVFHHLCTSFLWIRFAACAWSLHVDHHWAMPAVFIGLEMVGMTQPSLLLPLPAHSKLCGHVRGHVVAGPSVAALLRCS